MDIKINTRDVDYNNNIDVELESGSVKLDLGFVDRKAYIEAMFSFAWDEVRHNDYEWFIKFMFPHLEQVGLSKENVSEYFKGEG